VTQAELDRTFGWARRVEGVVFPAEVPDLIGRTLAQARDELTQARLQVGRIQNVAGQPVGTVIRQSRPAGQRVRYGTTVDLDIAAEIPVPNVLGMTQLEAGIALGFAGFNVGDISEEDDTGMRPGRVARQYPQPGMRVPPGTPVSLVIASRRLPPPPPDERWCTVPDIRYASEESAAGILREQHLRLGSVRRVEGRRAGATQNPQPGARVPCGSSVDLVIYSGPTGTHDEPPETFCTVPDLRQVPVERAAAFLRKYNLQLGRVQRAEGRVAGVIQNPEPGAQVRCGSSVDLVIYFVRSLPPDSGPAVETQPTNCIVPDVRRLSARVAQTTLKRAGLRLGRFEEGGDDRGQSPEPRSRVRCGTAVDVFAVIR
jgi:beta-lactam-binding protein with PASTA domain